jgi:hypothetical protein
MPNALRAIVAGVAIGGLAAALLALPAVLPPALADEPAVRTLLSTKDELFPRRIDVDNLVKPDFTMEPHISTEVLRSTEVRKIGFGKTTFVRIAETATGTYSSDAMTSPHIRYPGIHANGRRTDAVPGQLAAWSGGVGWTLLAPLTAGSFVTVTPFKGGTMISGGDGNCVFVGQSVYC